MVYRHRHKNFRIGTGTHTLRSARGLSTLSPGDHNKCSILKISTLNIQHAGNAKLEAATRCLEQMNMDISVLTETKLPIHNTFKSSGFDITHTGSRSNSIGGVALCVRPSSWFHVEGTKLHGHNVISTQLVSGRKRWLLIGAYIPPSETDHATIQHIYSAAADAEKYNIPTILIGDLNLDLDVGENNWEGYIDRHIETWTLIQHLKLHDLDKIYQKPLNRGNWTWYQRRQGRLLCKKLDYALVSNVRDFKYHKIKVPNVDTDHRMVVIGLKTDTTIQHRKYVKSRKTLKLQIATQNRGDILIKQLQKQKPRQILNMDHRSRSWISGPTWDLIDKKAAARREGNIEETKRLKKLLRKSLRKDRKIRADKAATEINNLLHRGNIRGAYKIIGRWYKKKTGKPPIPTYMEEEKTRTEYQQLYTQQPPTTINIPLFYNQAQVDDTIPSEEEIKQALKGMNLHKSPGCTGVTVEDLRIWMKESEGDTPRYDRWVKIVEIIQLAFTRTSLPQVFGVGILVLIPKSQQNQFRGIALLDVFYKLVSRIIHIRINNNVDYHNAIHGFRQNRGTTTAISELKLAMRSTRMDKNRNPRYTIFLDLTKAYDTLDRSRTLEILKAYGVGPNIIHIISQTWNMDRMIPKQSGCYGNEFETSRGVRQGDIMSPTLFNIVVDAFVNCCEAVYKVSHPAKEIPKVIFYADDGVISGNDAVLVQSMLDIYSNAFLRVGLSINVSKTKAMTMLGRKIQTRTARPVEFKEMPSVTFHNMRVCCNKCHGMITRRNLKTHQKTKKCNLERNRIQEEANEAIQIAIQGENLQDENENVMVELPVVQENNGTEQQIVQQEDEETIEDNTVFTVFGAPIEKVQEFQYLGRIMTATDDDKATVIHNLKKATKAWGNIRCLISYEKTRNLKAAVSVYRSIVESTLLYASETWVLTGCTALNRLEVFHRRCARFLTGQFIHPQENGAWVYPHTEDVFKTAKLESIKSYIEKRKVHVAKYLTPESTAMTEIANSVNIEINMEKVCWWKPANPNN